MYNEDAHAHESEHLRLKEAGRSVTALPNAAASSGQRVTFGNLDYKSDGTRWLSTQLFSAQFMPESTMPYAAVQQDSHLIIPNYSLSANGWYLEKLWRRYFLNTAQSGVNFYSMTLFVISTAGAAVNIFTPQNTSTLTTGSRWWPLPDGGEAVNQVQGPTVMGLQLRHTVNGAPGTFYGMFSVTYRLIG